MASVLITGATRGLGLELVKQFSRLPESEIGQIVAAGRSKEPSLALHSIINSQAEAGRIQYLELDVSSNQSILDAASITKETLLPQGLDILINNAGIQESSREPTPLLDASDFASVLNVNVVGVHSLTQALLPVMKASKGYQGLKKIVNISSTLGSISLVKNFVFAPVPAYKVSKAALNMLTAQWSQDVASEGFTVFGISPGWLRTDLGGVESADLPVEVGAQEVVRIVMEAKERDNGAFRNIHVAADARYPGHNAPW